MGRFAGYLGRKTINLINHVLNLTLFTCRLIGLFFRPQKSGRALVRNVVVDQIYYTAVQALPVLIPTALIVGSMIIIQMSMLAGQFDLGKIVVLLIFREAGPIITAIIVILRSATAVTIEVSYMMVLKEIEALEMSGIDPMRVVCLPRFVGITFAILSLSILFGMIAMIGGWGIALAGGFFPVSGFFNQIAKAVTVADIAAGMVKALLFGVAITVTCLYHGFSSREEITEVPVATSRSSIECFMICLVINIIVSILFSI